MMKYKEYEGAINDLVALKMKEIEEKIKANAAKIDLEGGASFDLDDDEDDEDDESYILNTNALNISADDDD